MMKTFACVLFVCAASACVADEPIEEATIADELVTETDTDSTTPATSDGVSPDSKFGAVTLEPDPCAGRSSDSGTGGDYYDGITIDHQWSRRVIYGTWYNCGGPAGQADRVRIDVATDTDGPCITVPFRSTGSSVFVRKYKFIPSTFRGWYRC